MKTGYKKNRSSKIAGQLTLPFTEEESDTSKTEVVKGEQSDISIITKEFYGENHS
jgi:hypothetical protein